MDLPEAEELRRALRELVPEVRLEWQSLPGTPWKALLLDESSADQPLPPASAEKAMESPPFWSLLWPSGYLLCRLLLKEPNLVTERRCVDLGSGSGLLSVALAWAGAKVAAFDCDPQSRMSTKLQCRSNKVAVVVGEWWNGEPCDTLFLADFLYDESNLSLLERFQNDSQEIVIVDSRLSQLNLPGFSYLGRCTGVAFPDLDPHREFGTLRIWYAGPRRELWRKTLCANFFEKME